jgi:hypothetical protein
MVSDVQARPALLGRLAEMPQLRPPVALPALAPAAQRAPAMKPPAFVPDMSGPVLALVLCCGECGYALVRNDLVEAARGTPPKPAPPGAYPAYACMKTDCPAYGIAGCFPDSATEFVVDVVDPGPTPPAPPQVH